MTRSTRVANEAKERDGHACVKCGVSHPSKDRFNAHHIVPLHAGGEDKLDNVATLCPHCHRYAPEALRDPNMYEPVFEDYAATGRRPEVDMAVFGVSADVGSQEIEDVFDMFAGWFRDSEENTEITDPGFYWLAMASVGGYGIIGCQETIRRYCKEAEA